MAAADLDLCYDEGHIITVDAGAVELVGDQTGVLRISDDNAVLTQDDHASWLEFWTDDGDYVSSKIVPVAAELTPTDGFYLSFYATVGTTLTEMMRLHASDGILCLTNLDLGVNDILEVGSIELATTGTIGITGEVSAELTFTNSSPDYATFNNTRLGIGTTGSPDAMVHAENDGGTDQLNLAYNNAYYATFLVDSGGRLTITAGDPSLPSNADIVLMPRSGLTGIGVADPQGSFHQYGDRSGIMHWECETLAGVAQTVIPSGTGDVGWMIYVQSIVYPMGCGTAAEGHTCWIKPDNSEVIYDDGSNEVTLSVAADGEVTVVRTGGSENYDVTLWLMWI